MKEVFLGVLTVSLTCSLLLAPLLVYGKKLQSRYAAQTLYFLWLLLAIRMVLPLPLTGWQAPVTVAVPAYQVTIPATPPAAPKAPVLPWNAGVYNMETAEPEVRVAVTQTVELAELAATVWAAGAGLFLLWQMVAYLFARRAILRTSCPATDDEWALLGRLCTDLGVGKALNLCRSERVESPLLLGLLNPMVVLPDRDSDPDELEAVLRHELCHLKRGDVAYKSFFLLVNALHWFNPLVWLMARAASRNVEFCCDDQVLRNADAPTKKHYGEVLLYTAAGSIYPAFSTHFGSGKEQMRARLINLFQPKKNSALLVCAVAVLALLAGGAVAFESGRSNVEGTPPMVLEEATSTPNLEMPALNRESLYVRGTDVIRSTTNHADDTITVQVVNYNGEKGTITETGETRMLELADEVRLIFFEEGEMDDRLAEGKGTQEWRRAIFDFLYWPALRAQAYPGRTDYLELTVDDGKVSKMRWRMTPVGESETVNNLPWELSQAPAAYPDNKMSMAYAIVVEAPMDFTMTVERWAGTLTLGIRGTATGRYAYNEREFDSETATFHLEPGEYDVELGLAYFHGNYHLAGVLTSGTAPTSGSASQ